MTPFRTGCLVVLAACLIFISFDGQKPHLVAALDSWIASWMFQLRGAQPTVSNVAIVDIDEKSLRTMGQWPWPRNLLSHMVERIDTAGAKAVGLDMVFAEQDRASPHLALKAISSQAPAILPQQALEDLLQAPALNNDLLLGQTLSKTNSVLGYVFLMQEDGLNNANGQPFPTITMRTAPPGIPFQSLRLLDAYRSVVNVASVSQSASEGFLNFFPDVTGVASKAPLFLRMNGVPYPSFALEMVRVAEQENSALLHISPLDDQSQHDIIGVQVGKHFVPTNDTGQITINYRGPAKTFPYLSAVDLLENKDLALLKDRIVLIGTTAAGLHDLRATPFSSAFPGVEIHATIIDNILTDNVMKHDIATERGVTFLVIILGGIALSAVFAFGSPLLGGACGFGLLAAITFGNYKLFFLNNQLVGTTYPLLVILALFLIITMFNHFFVGREKRFIDLAFSRYVSPHIVEQLKRDPKQLTLNGVETEITILFSDIRGFTSFSEQLSASALSNFMNTYLTSMSKEIFKTNGTIDKFIGDAIMAIWGAPLEDPLHAKRATAAALGMVCHLSSTQEQWQSEGLPCIEIGIGINTGVASVGNFGSEDRFDYTAIGDNVNLASRLEGLTKLYGVPVIISETTRKLIGDQFFCRKLDRVRVAGKSNPVEIYEPLLEGPPPPELKEEVLLYESALELYFSRQFKDAAEIFNRLLREGESPLYCYHLNRTRHCLTEPPQSDWDGVTAHTRK